VKNYWQYLTEKTHSWYYLWLPRIAWVIIFMLKGFTTTTGEAFYLPAAIVDSLFGAVLGLGFFFITYLKAQAIAKNEAKKSQAQV